MIVLILGVSIAAFATVGIVAFVSLVEDVAYGARWDTATALPLPDRFDAETEAAIAQALDILDETADWR